RRRCRVLTEWVSCFGEVRRESTSPDQYSRAFIAAHKATRAGPLGEDTQIAKPGELPPKSPVCVDAIRKACLTNLDGAQDCLFPEVEPPIHKPPVCNLGVGRGMQAIAGNH